MPYLGTMRFTAIWLVLRLLLISLVGFYLLVFLFQRRLMYFPEKSDEISALAKAKRLGLEPWRDGSGHLLGWIAKARGGPVEGRLLVCHGNAGRALDRVYFARGFQASEVPRRWEVRILEYPGYGSRSGTPSEQALVKAALEAIDALDQEPPAALVVAGESIGSGVAALAAAQRSSRVKGLFLVTPLNRMSALARLHYPFIPTLLLRDRYEATAALRDFRGPLAELLAERDEVIPSRLGQALFEGFQGSKRLWISKGRGHNDWDADESNPMWAEVSEFLLPK